MANVWHTIKLEGRLVTLPRIRGKSEVFSAVPFYLEKRRWVPDDEAETCYLCDLKFTKIKRKHHCRNCGRVLCSKCCNEKVPLPQFEMNEAQKTCSVCRPIAELIAKSRGEYVIYKQEAANGLMAMTKQSNDIVQLVENGGVQTLIFLSAQGDNVIKEAASISIHTLAQHFPLLPLLRNSGAIKALKHFLATSNDQPKTLTHTLSALALFCKNNEDKLSVLQEGIGETLLKHIESTGTISVLAAGILCSLAENPDHHLILFQDPSTIHKIVSSLKTNDVQKQEIVAKMLGYISTSSESFRHRLIQEDQVCGYPMLNILKDADLSKSALLANVVCSIGNIATNLSDQNTLPPYLTAVANLLDKCNEGPQGLTTSIARTLANFSEFPSSSLLLVQRLPSVVASLLRSDIEIHRLYACRILVCLCSIEPTVTVSELTRNGIDTFVEELIAVNGIADVINNVLLRKASRLSFPC